MSKYLFELCDYSRGGIPLIIAGDIFDVPRPPIEIVNYAMHVFSQFGGKIFAIPGQHDLPSHDIDCMKSAAYGTLKFVPNFHNLGSGPFYLNDFVHGKELRIYGAGWGLHLQDEIEQVAGVINIGACHRYLWKDDSTKHEMAEDKDNVKKWADKKYARYDVVIIGDNHSQWEWRRNPTTFVNNGSIMIRSVIQVVGGFTPKFTAIYEDGSAESIPFSSADPAWFRPVMEKGTPDVETTTIDHVDFIEELQKVSGDTTDVMEAINLALQSSDITEQAIKLIKRIVNDNR